MAGWAVNAKRVRRVMRELGLAAAPPLRRVRTTDSDHPFPRYPNLVTEYRDYADARRQLGRFLDAVYNRKRIHSALGYLTPAEFEQQWRADRKGPPAVQLGAAPTGIT